MKVSLERITNVATLAACLFVTGHVVATHYGKPVTRQPPVYKSGDLIRDSGALGFGKAKLTLMLGTASTCHFCTESMDYYSRLTTIARQHGVRVVGFTNESPDVNRRYLSSYGIQADNVVGATSERVNLSATPTLIVVNVYGRVLKAWLGKLDADAEKEVLKLVATT